MNKPTIPENNLPEHFAIDGVKSEFTTDKIQNGYQAGVADIFGGGQLNYWLNTSGENINYLRKICDFITNLPVAKTITVDTNGELVYRDWLGGRNFGELVYSAIPLSDSSLKLLDGSVLTYTGVYKNFIDYIADLVATYPSLFVTESFWQSQVSTYGVCGKFVYDSTNKTVRLPKVTGIIEGTIDISALGSTILAGLPNLTTTTVDNHTHTTTVSTVAAHTHEISSSGAHTHTTDNAGKHRHASRNTTDEDDGGGRFTSGVANTDDPIYTDYAGEHHHKISSSGAHTHTTNAANKHTHTVTNSGAGKHNHTITWGATTNTVQPQTVKMFIYITVSTSILRTTEEIDLSQVQSQLDGKAAIDGTNMVNALSSSAKTYFTRLALPSKVKTNIVIPTSGDTITAPSDGYICCTEDIKLTNTTRYLYGTSMPVVMNDSITVEYDATDENSEIIFVYAQGGM